MLFPIQRAFLLVLPVLVACSGKVDVDPAPTGTGGAGGSGSTCPSEAPVDGTPCVVPAAETCEYGECCPRPFSCVAGTWSESDVSCLAPLPCPSFPPLEGAPCQGSACMQESPCVYSCGEDMPFTVTCGSDNLWHNDMPALCSDAMACGDTLQCPAGHVCVAKQAFGTEYTCAPDPCAPDPLSCACVGAICGDGYVCIQASGKEVLCECPACK